MKWKKLLKAALSSIMKNRMRSSLTMLGIVIGVSAVIVMVTVGKGSQQNIQNEISSLGTNLMMVSPGSSQRGGVRGGAGSMNTLTTDDVEILRKKATLLEAISPLIRVSGQVVAEGNNWSTSITGVSPEYLSIRDWKLAEGKFFSERDEKSRAKVAVVGKTIVDELYNGLSPVGKRIRIRNAPFTVIGVLEEKGEGFGGNQDDIVLVPSSTASYRLLGERYVHMIYASTVNEDDADAAREEITHILRAEHHLATKDADNFTINSQTDIIETASTIGETITLLLGSIAGVSLLVGGIGIMNIMLVSVTERTREIGIRMAVGARGNDVLTQFLVEAVVLCTVGGFIGMWLGFAISYGLTRLLDIPLVITGSIVFIAIAFSSAVGIFFGWYPARKAASLDPIEALRYE